MGAIDTPLLKAKLQTNESVIEHFIGIGCIDALAFYYLLKSEFRNSTIYSYSPAKAAQKFNLTPYLVEKYIRQLRKEGLVRKNHKNLTLAGRSTMVKKFGLDQYTTQYGQTIKTKVHKCTLFILPEYSLQEIKIQLYSKILQRKIDQQEYVRRIKADCKKMSCQKYSQYRNETLFDYNVLSFRKIAKIFKLPLSTCHKVIKQMEAAGLVDANTIAFQVEKSTPQAHKAGKAMLDHYFGYTYFNEYDKYIWAIPGTMFTFPLFCTMTGKPMPSVSLTKHVYKYGMTASLFI